ncbi:MAG: MBL fold metallo-hydrolase [Chlamydiales bacterium]
MEQSFKTIPLGVTGGPNETDISGYLLYPSANPDETLCLDAGSLLGGLRIAGAKGNLKDYTLKDKALIPVGEVFLNKIRAYLITHAHLDHIAALVINSQADALGKYIVGINSTINNLRDYIFNAIIWPNYGSEGNEPVLRHYEYIRVPLHEEIEIPGTKYRIEAYRLSHPHEYPSSAFLIQYQGSYVLYLGDTSPDALEKEKHLSHIWKRIAPLIKEKRIRALFLECSVPDADSAQVVYGHLNPKLMMAELQILAKEAGCSLEGLKVVITHRKESLYVAKTRESVKEELLANNKLKLDLIFPSQGDLIEL